MIEQRLNEAEDASRGCRRVAALALEVARSSDKAVTSPPAADIVSMCRELDERVAALPLEHKTIDTILDELHSLAASDGGTQGLLNRVRRFRVDSLGPTSDWARLPVQAGVAQQVIRFLGAAREYEIADIEKLASRDPVLAAALIRAANSAIFSPQARIPQIRAAISYIGTTAAREVLLAAAVRPLFACAGLLRLWKHSLQMAQLCSALGVQSGLVDPQQGVLIGLVHDIGSLALKTLPGTTLERYGRLVDGGCPPAYAEHLLFGRDHGEIGGDILSQWNFPSSIVEAVRFHHQPERSEAPVAALVYLAEFWSGLDEDVPSLFRIGDCAARTGISIESLSTAPARACALNVLS